MKIETVFDRTRARITDTNHRAKCGGVCDDKQLPGEEDREREREREQ